MLLNTPQSHTVFKVKNYNLSATLDSGQAFRWTMRANCWEGVVGRQWIRLETTSSGVKASTWPPVNDWKWLERYLQVELDIFDIIQTFPKDPPIRAALRFAPGLRILRQNPWECLASFILSSTKRIVQIRQVIQEICRRFGEPIYVPENIKAFAFPTVDTIASLSESDLRACKMGFRAPYLLETARQLHKGKLCLDRLSELDISAARLKLMEMPGVGPKIAECVLLFSLGFDSAFPLDVWMKRAMTKLYFRGNKTTQSRLETFVGKHFGPYAGYAQQYIFHYVRHNPV
jgi:N-glycosylase/DNA lyase